MKVEPDGLSTERLPAGGLLLLNFKRAAMIYHPSGDAEVVIPLAGHTQATLSQALLERMQPGDLNHTFDAVPQDRLAQGLIDALAAQGHKGKELMGTQPLNVDQQQASDYAEALYVIFTGIARFKARLNGPMTPAVVWPEHFDLSTLWFLDGDMDDYKAHLNFGFAPFSEGFPRPYLYAYAYPYPPDVQLPPLPAPARWTTETWKGVVVDYEDIAWKQDPAAFVEQMCLDIFAAIRPLLG